MKNMLLLALMALCLQSATLLSDCYKCQEIREKNKSLPPLKYEFYDDYLEALRAEGKPLPGDLDISEEEPDADKKED